jgi:hypothetical protein
LLVVVVAAPQPITVKRNRLVMMVDSQSRKYMQVLLEKRYLFTPLQASP